MCEAIVVSDQTYLAVVLGILEWIQTEKYERRKNDEKKECTDYYYYDAAIPNGAHRETLDVGSFACRGWRGNGKVPRIVLGQFTRYCSSDA